MARKNIFGMLAALLPGIQLLFAQVNVNQLTGAANVVIPIYKIGRGVSVPVSLVYNGSGIKVRDVEGTGGMGWNVEAGGQISRRVRGLPDDSRLDVGSNIRTGWMYTGTAAGNITGFSIANNGSNCTYETTDISYINSHFKDTVDTEPDIFNVSAPGLSCQLVFDAANHTFRTIPYMDLKISDSTNTTSGQPLFGAILWFKITNDRGVTYKFASPELVKETTLPIVGGSGAYLQNKYLQYQNTINYYDSWVLTRMTDANGNGASLTYTTSTDPRTGIDSVFFYKGAGSRTDSLHNLYGYLDKTIVTPQNLTQISTINKDITNEYLNFTWATNIGTHTISLNHYGTFQPVITSIKGVGRDFEFNYSNVLHGNSHDTSQRWFLRSFTDTGSTTPINYKFAYLGETPITGGDYTTVLPDSVTTHIDYWGYYSATAASLVPTLLVNPSNAVYPRYAIANGDAPVGTDYTYVLAAHSNRGVDTDNVIMGALKTITYAQGGTTTIKYESNDFLDVPSGYTQQGNGIRAYQVVNHDNIANVDETINYTYTNPSTGNSSGKPITMPVYGFTTPSDVNPTTAIAWNLTTIRSQNDLSQEDHSIMYEYVNVQKSGMGNTLFQYAIPATNWDNSAAPVCTSCSTEWYPTMDYVARQNCSATYSAITIKNMNWTYPFTPNPNYDFERGLPVKETNYVGTGTIKASETTYNYQRTSAPGTITGFRYDDNGNHNYTPALTGTTYAKYLIYYGTSELVSSVTKKIYDTQGSATAQTTTVSFTYGSTWHKPLTQSVTNSDGSIVTTNYKYTKDYTITATNTNPTINALYQLQQRNINAPVEIYTTVVPVTGGTYVTGAFLTLYHSYPTLSSDSIYMPSQQLQLVQPTGLINTSFTPFSINTGSHTTSYDSHYFATANFKYYDFTGRLQTADDANKHLAGSYLDFNTNNTVVAIKNAAASEMVFEDFDSDLTPEWTFHYPSFTAVTGSHTGIAQGLTNGQAISYTLQRNKQATNYIFSAWLKCGSGTSLSLNVSGGGSGTYTLSPANTSGNYVYYQKVIPLTGITTDTVALTITLTSTDKVGFDDILFYPQNAEIGTFAYNPTNHYKIVETNTNGISAYYSNDKWGRLIAAYDQDKNMVRRNTYALPGATPGYTKQENILVSGILNNAQADTLGLARKQTSKVYNDGLGRGLQAIAVQASPLLNDLIQPMAYDITGRPKASWLPYAGQATDTAGSYRRTAISTNQPAFYRNTSQYLIPTDSAAYSQAVFENSPLQRMLKAGMAGKGYQPTGAPLTGYNGTQHFKKIGYRVNTATDSVFVWGPDGSKQSANYTANYLSVAIDTNEDNLQTRIFSDIAGRTILKREVFSSTVNYDTYYVYNNAGMIAFIIPPKAIKLMKTSGNYSLTQSTIAPLIFTFAYDGRGRLVTKKVPTKGPMHIVYDPLNRPVLLQDTLLAAAHKWNYIKYDVKGRAISQGIYVNTGYSTLAAMQAHVDSMANSYNTAWYESRSNNSGTGYYTNSIFPISGITALAYAYNDDYDLNFDSSHANDFGYKTTGLPGEVGPTKAPIQGMPTMSLQSTVSNTASPVWLFSTQFYDKNLHPIQSRTNNLLNHLGDTVLTDTKTIVPDFIGMPTVSQVVKVTSTTTTVLTTPIYDNQRRITSVTQRYNNKAPVRIAEYHYNELGQLTSKGLGIGSATSSLTLSTGQSVSSTGAVTNSATTSISLMPSFGATNGAAFSAQIAPAYQQLVDYRYNIRGQLLSINNSKLHSDTAKTQEDSHALFGMTFVYNSTDSNLGNTPYYSGRLSAVKWMARNGSNAMGDERAYRYSYDNVGRYTAANYLRRDSTATGAFSLTHGWDEGISAYDENGNIQALHRNSTTQGSGGTVTAIDQLKYTYDSFNANQLYMVTDSTGNNAGFGIQTGGSSGGHYLYDANGNLATDPYKNIALSYNVMNKTDEIDFTAVSGKSIKYIYDANGTVLQKIANDGTTTTTTSYIDEFVYVNGTLSYFAMPEGRVSNIAGVLSPQYIISDQQGNARITFNNTAPGNSAKVIQENSYYGFGMVMAGSTVTTPMPQNKNLYNGGSEWLNDFSNQPDYYQTYFRNYDAALGRFVGADPMAVSSSYMSVYQYAGNNPVMGNDPFGNKVKTDFSYLQGYYGSTFGQADWAESQAQERAWSMNGGGWGTNVYHKGDGTENDPMSGSLSAGIALINYASGERVGNADAIRNGSGTGTAYYFADDGTVSVMVGSKYDYYEQRDSHNVQDFIQIGDEEAYQGRPDMQPAYPGAYTNAAGQIIYRDGVVSNGSNASGSKIDAVFIRRNGDRIELPGVNVTVANTMKGRGATFVGGGHGFIHLDPYGAGLEDIEHEYGHYLDYLSRGALYYELVVEPLSGFNAATADYHQYYWTEIRADQLSVQFFGPNSAIAKSILYPH